MPRPRDRRSAEGLLPRMEARPWADGKTVTYRYHPMGGAPVNLGTDKAAAVRHVANLLGVADDQGTIRNLWGLYKLSPTWPALAERTRADYEAYSGPLLRVFGDMLAAHITAPMVARYLRVERAEAPVRANREKALLSILMGLAIERGEALHNPCRERQVARNKERPRADAPDPADLRALIDYAGTLGPQYRIVCMAAEFAALAGSRKIEFLRLTWPQVGENEIRLMRAKQRAGTQRVEIIAISPALRELLQRLRTAAAEPRRGQEKVETQTVFPNRFRNPYTDAGFAAMWGKLIRAAVQAGVVQRRFTFHDLRAHYTTTHKERTGDLPDLHSTPTTTARVYERSRKARRTAL